MRRIDSCSRRFSAAISLAISGSSSDRAGSNVMVRAIEDDADDAKAHARVLDAPRASDRDKSMRLAPFPLAPLLALLLASLLASTSARADAAPTRDASRGQAAMDTRERRNGLVIGIMGGFGLAGASGYPNAASK